MTYFILHPDHTYREASFQEWLDAIAEAERSGEDWRRVGLDDVAGRRVSTVWLMGIDHSMAEPPVLFETMVFSDDSWTEELCWRYSTWEQAEQGHREACRLVALKAVEVTR